MGDVGKVTGASNERVARSARRRRLDAIARGKK